MLTNKSVTPLTAKNIHKVLKFFRFMMIKTILNPLSVAICLINLCYSLDMTNRACYLIFKPSSMCLNVQSLLSMSTMAEGHAIFGKIIFLIVFICCLVT